MSNSDPIVAAILRKKKGGAAKVVGGANTSFAPSSGTSDPMVEAIYKRKSAAVETPPLEEAATKTATSPADFSNVPEFLWEAVWNEVEQHDTLLERALEERVKETLKGWGKQESSPPPTRKGKRSKYRTAGEAARALCAWIDSRTKGK